MENKDEGNKDEGSKGEGSKDEGSKDEGSKLESKDEDNMVEGSHDEERNYKESKKLRRPHDHHLRVLRRYLHRFQDYHNHPNNLWTGSKPPLHGFLT